MNDQYDHPINGLIYVVENIPGPAEENEAYKELLNNYNSQLALKCECKGNCLDEQCLCIHNSKGKNYTLSNNNDLKTYKIINGYTSDKSILECNDLCLCINNCGNKLVQKGPCDELIVRICDIKEKGFGLHARNVITKGSFICEYAGELITKSQALKRHKLNVVANKMNFIFCLNEHSNGKLIQTFVDPSTFGNVGRYVNHSCNPNCIIIPVRVNSPLPKLAIFSLCDISPNHEITIDYGSKNYSGSQETNSYIENGRKKCLCNSSKCKGSLPYDLY